MTTGMDKIVDIMQDRILKESDDILSSLEEQMSNPTKTFPLADYKTTFLRMFSPDVTDDEFNRLYDLWLQVAGDMLTPVGLVDHEDNIVTTVPGFRSTEGLVDFNRSQNESVSNAAVVQELERRNIKELADRKFLNNLLRFSDNSELIYSEEWYSFLTYIGVVTPDKKLLKETVDEFSSDDLF